VKDQLRFRLFIKYYRNSDVEFFNSAASTCKNLDVLVNRIDASGNRVGALVNFLNLYSDDPK
jgi:hypothetical protein